MINLKLIGLIGILSFILYTTSVSGSTSTKNRCDETRSEKINTACIECRENIIANCPTGFRKTTRGKGRRGCRYRIQAGARTRPARGCYHTCIRVVQKVECCSGFWGRDCQPCPSDRSGQVCGGRGTCSDLMAGNGTCACRGRVAGSTCEKCQQDNQYGPSCESTCGCVHGRCDSGVGRPGSCLCDSGYGGALCDHVLEACRTRNCPGNSRCLSSEGTLQCLCNPGYEGDTCQPINPCDDSATLCSQFANCSHTGPDKYFCTCNPGYSGDGKWCGPIDRCQVNNGGCPTNTTTCLYTGPGQSVCQCKLGYENLTSSGCSLIDQCGAYENSTCDSRANCTTIDDHGTIRVSCQCPIGFLNKGLNCHADLFTEMQLVNETGPFANQLNTAIQMFMNTYFQDLFFSTTPYTLLLPQDEAFGSELGQPNSSETWKARARAHIIPSQIVIDFQSESAKSMYPLLGSRYSIKALRPITPDPNPDDDDAGVFAQINFANSYRTGGMVASNFWAANGVFYIIDTVLEPPSVFSDSGYDDVLSLSLLQALKLTPDASSFLTMTKKSSTWWKWFQTSGIDFTFLIPSNDAVASLTEDEMKALDDPVNRNKLDILLGHHMLPRRLKSTALVGVTTLETSEDTLEVNVSESSGMITVGNSKVLVSDISIRRGSSFHIIDKVLIPDYIRPLVNNWCTRTNVVSKQGPCEPCGTILTCPQEGEYLTRKLCAREVETISGSSSSISNKFGCRAVCNVNVSTSVCCIGYFGPNCESCPGPTGNQCNGNGECDDGVNGNGLCSCSPGFTSPDCSICASPTMYGDGCYTNCSCVHGVCDNRAKSRGICRAGSCQEGWAGENCDRGVLPCGSQALICHQHAICLQTDSVESCVCEPGYSGDGTECVEFNPCTDSDDRGGCSRNAVCLYYGKGNTNCSCKDHFQGDGYSCDAINPCNLPNRGNCHQHASCIFTEPGLNRCLCKDGYRGNGQVCTEINNCLQNNGGCHGRATCTKTGPGTNDCKCLTGYSGDGRQCVGTLSVEITEHPELSLIQHWAETMPSVQTLFNSISSYQITVFLPLNQAWHSMKPGDYQFWITEQHLPDLLRHHIVVGSQGVPSYLLKGNSKLDTLLPTTTITVTNQTSGVTEKDVGSNVTRNELIPTLGSLYAKIVIPDLRIFNGVVHVIDDVLLPPRDAVHDHPSLAQVVQNSTGTDLAIFSVFLSSLNSSGVIAQIEASNDSYTIFALSNDDFDPLSVSENKALVMGYHVIVGKLIRVDDVQSGQHESTLAGPGYQVTLTRMHGRVFINGKQTTRTGVRTAKGIVHGFIDSPLTPIKSRCDRTTTNVYRTPCLPCMLNFPCPDESPSSMVAQAHCYFRGFGFTGDARNRVGCRKLCRIKVKSKTCCSGFYGGDCEPCPGGIGNTCFKQGNCFDGVAGNGTCSCTDSKFAGLACDDCAPGLFGEDCGSKCTCANGSCDHGKKGTGKCVCQKGFTGTACNQPIVQSNACNDTCDSSAVCSGNLAIFKCVCASGYEGDGTHCTPVNPCRNPDFDRCHAYASCVYRGAGQYECKCKDGFQGDGTYCFEINPCLGNTTDCNEERGLCHHTGPNQYNCVCKEGYSGDGKTCSPVDPCATDNGGCHPFAKCTKQGPGSRSCSCYANYIGDGISKCIGSAYQEYLNDGQLTWFLQGSMVRSTLDTTGLITVFLPYIPADQAEKYSRTDTQFFLNHVVGCGSFNLTDLQKAGQVTSMVGNPLNITTQGGQVYLNGNIRLAAPRILANGVAYRINQTIPAPPPIELTSGSDVTTNALLLKNMGFNKFAELMKKSAMFNVLGQQVHGRWTMFIPTDDAFARLSSYKLRQIANDNDAAMEYAKYHLVRQSFLAPSDAMKTQELTTMQGSDITIACSSTNIGKFLLNGGESTVTRFVTKKLFSTRQSVMSSALYVIDKVLLPPSVGGRCDVKKNVTTLSGCTFCHSLMGCPTGMANIGIKRNAMCKSTDSSGSVTMFIGCQSICTTYHVTKNCCDDFFGKDCHPCPGGIDNSCSHNGQCDDTINGTGKCTCDDGFTGYACELCETGRYGFGCERCKCSVNGKCMEGMNGDGRCFCDQGYTGEICDKKLVHPSNCSVPCVANAVCVEGGQCVCQPGYRGVGTDLCEMPDLCQERPNGGCSRHATCQAKDTLSVRCTCIPPYVGDGFVCEGTDPCNDYSNPPNCHILARCVYVGPGQTRCDCMPGYKGDGVNQCVVDSEWTNQGPRICAVNNGGCSSNAVCVDLATSALQQTRKVKCSCKKGYVGDGLTCNGNVFQVLSQADYEMGKFYQKIIRSGNMQLMFKLRKSPNITLFVPVDDALTFRKLRFKTLRRHVVTGHSYTTIDLQTLPVIVSDSKTPLPIQSFPSGLYVSGVRVRKADVIATNGVIHTIEGVLPRKPETITTSTSTVASPAVTPSKTNPPGKVTKSPKASTTTAKKPIDDGGIPKNSSLPPGNQTTTKSPPKVTKKPPAPRSSGNGVKVGVAVAIVLLVLIAIIVVYWKKRSAMFVFRPLSERARLTSRSEDAFDDPVQGFGMMNPAYDSTGFNDQTSGAPADEEVEISSPLEAEEREEEEALIAFNDITD